MTVPIRGIESHIPETPQRAAARLTSSLKQRGFQSEALHEYTTNEGTPWFWVLRLRNQETNEKEIRPMRKNADGTFELKRPDFEQGLTPLYGLGSIYGFQDNTLVTFVLVEGEQCADLLNAMNAYTDGEGRKQLFSPWLAVSTLGGSGSIDKADFAPLENHNISLWPDNDEAGQKGMEATASKLLALRFSIHMIDAPSLGLPPKGDAVEFILNKLNERLMHGLKVSKRELTINLIKQYPEDLRASVAKAVADIIPDEEYKETTIEQTEVASEVEAVTEQGGEASPMEKDVERLANLSPIEYDACRKEEAKQINVRVTTLDSAVKERRKATATNESGEGLFPEVTPWPELVDGCILLNEMKATIGRFIVCDEQYKTAATLWCAFTWFIDSVSVAPIAVITAPEKRCGKSQMLDVMGRMSARKLDCSNITAAAMYRTIEAFKPTLLVDEADAFMEQNEELRGIINSGHTRQTAHVIRTVGDDFEPKQFSTYCAKVLCGIGKLAPTIMDRGVVIEMRRKQTSDKVERLRRANPNLFEDICAKLSRWSTDNAQAVKNARPESLERLNDREQDNWEPLFAIADIAGGEWPTMAREAATAISKINEENTVSQGVELLGDIKEIFDKPENNERITTVSLLEELNSNIEKQWATLNNGRSMDARQLASRLKGYQIHPKPMRIFNGVAKGYQKSDFMEAWKLYLSPPQKEAA